MGKLTGFLEVARKKPPARPVAERLRDWREVDAAVPGSGRCATRGRAAWTAASRSATGVPAREPHPRLERPASTATAGTRPSTGCTRPTTSPSSPGRLCPAPCEGSCVLGINDDPVTIKADRGGRSSSARSPRAGWGRRPPAVRTGKRVAVVGSGPAGLAAAEQLNRAGHLVTVFERADRIGGLLRYGIPEFKMEKRVLDRRLGHHGGRGRRRSGRACNVGVDLPAAELRGGFDAVVLAGGAPLARDLPVPGRELTGDPLRDGLPDAAEPALRRRRRARRQCDHREGQARRHHRRRRHRRRLPRHGAPAGRAIGPPVRGAAAPARRARAGEPLAAVAEHLPRVLRARGGRRAAVRGVHPAIHRRRAGPRAEAARGERRTWSPRAAA